MLPPLVLPPGGLFAEKTWLASPEPFPLTTAEITEIERLGHRLQLFLQAANSIYYRSVAGKLPRWIAEYADLGKPPELLEIARNKAWRADLPQVIRPDLILTETGYALAEIDSVPGGVGLTAWLNEAYAQWPVVGGARGMLEGFASLFPQGADVVISAEAADYRPEMEWLCAKLGAGYNVHEAETYQTRARDIYRFFELFDLPNLPNWQRWVQSGARISPPLKPWLEEKLWLALFWSRPLRELWRQELRANHQEALAQVIPRSWIVDPRPLPPHAVIPGLDVSTWAEVGDFSQSQRELVLKLSGFSELAWGSRSVVMGHDWPQAEWGKMIAHAESTFTQNPYVLQTFHKGKLVRHPFYDPATGAVRQLEGRVRLCPYFFTPSDGGRIQLGGILATICPADKKVLHGMSDAILVPCYRAD